MAAILGEIVDLDPRSSATPAPCPAENGLFMGDLAFDIFFPSGEGGSL
jgi:hypothetical protein